MHDSDSVGRNRRDGLPEKYDVVVVGAGFAGLACARQAARRGLSVLVLERQSGPGARIHTTGILVHEAWTEWKVPAPLVRRIDRVRVYTPAHDHIELERNGYFFMATDTARLMHHLARETRRAGVEIRFGQGYRGVKPGPGPLLLQASGVTCRFLVGADGARSAVAGSFGLDRNRRLLKGVEWEFEPVDGVADCLHCFIDPEFAPGYIGWVVPGVATTQVGLALHRDRQADLPGFVARLDPLFGLSRKTVVEKRGGVIPFGGLLRNFFGERVMLIGDAAGMVSPLTAGGIHHAWRFGKIAGDALADHLAGGAHPGPVVRRAYPGVAWKHAARWGYDRLPVARALEAGLLTRSVFRRVAAKVFFGL
ncbi:MAG: NAD(P)/FAD-dependent oxidoreductase [Gammaproteobacteria bacterium]|nr:NAD(P)/FAD-dependent oxidoreductase [Gammaproteobacteria bacterium]MDE0649835.1 NAD(P)/FAD-dependent oxidoreductase [Gammaproteobacteria bacterium]